MPVRWVYLNSHSQSGEESQNDGDLKMLVAGSQYLWLRLRITAIGLF